MDKEKILQSAKDNVEIIVRHLFPNAIRDNKRILIGNINGIKGTSLVIELDGNKKGLWHDFATGQGGDIIDLWAEANSLNAKTDFLGILKQIGDFLGVDTKKEEIKPKMAKKPDYVWIYYDANLKPIVRISRYNTPTGKTFYPFDIIAGKFGLPAIRPLYNIPLIAKSNKEAQIIFVEGEKCAEAITKLGYCGTTTPGGANAQLDKVDWQPLKDKNILIWPDNDEPGIKYAEKVFNVLKNIAVDVSILELPVDKPKKWDCADATIGGFDVKRFIETTRKMKPSELFKTKDQTEPQKQQKPFLSITDWKIDQFSQTPKPTDYLIKNVFPLGVVSMVAAVGDTGKSLLLLDLAIKVAVGSSDECFGNRIMQSGSVVIFTAEDDKNEIERRLQRLDPKGYRFMCNNEFYIIPLQNASGAFAIIEEKPNNIYETETYKNIKSQLLSVKNLKLIVFDPLVSFVNGDITFNSTASAFLINSLSMLAVETGASVIITHHLRKTNGEINSIDDVREAIRGSSALVNGVRLAYAFWPIKLNKQREYFKSKEKNFISNALFNGAVVKANNKADRDIKIYLRDENGLLKALKSNNHINFETKEFEDILYNNIVQLNKNNIRITFTGKEGLFERKDLLVEELKNLSKRQIRAIALNLLQEKRIIKSSSGELVAVISQDDYSLFNYMEDKND